MKRRDDIPDSIKRAVRQKCRFSCVVCGSLLCEIHHIIPHSQCNSHELDNLVMLCKKHHGEVNFMYPGQEKDYLRQHLQQENFWIRGAQLHSVPIKLKIGNNIINSCFLSSRHKCILLFIEGHMYVDVALTQAGIPVFTMKMNDSSGKKVFEVIDNVIAVNCACWDIEQIGTKTIIREGSRKILLSIDFCPVEKMVGIKANIRGINSKQLRINEKGVHIGRRTLVSNCFVEGCNAGLLLLRRSVDSTGCIEGNNTLFSNITVGRHPIGFKNVFGLHKSLVLYCEIAFLFEQKFLDTVV